MTTAEPSLSQGPSEAAEPGRRGLPGTGALLPTWDLISTKNLEIRQRRGLMITTVELIVLPAVLFNGLRLLFHAVDPHTYAPAGSPNLFSQVSNLIAEFGFIAAAALGAAAGTTDLSDGMFRHLVITRQVPAGPLPGPHPGRPGHHRPARRPGVRDDLPRHQLRGHPQPDVGPRVRPQRPGASRPGRAADLAAAAPAAGCQQRIDRRFERIARRPGHLPGADPADPLGDRQEHRQLHRDYVASEIGGSNPADNEMAKIGLWIELEAGIGFLVGLGFGSFTGQRTTTTIVLIALEIIVTPFLARVQLPCFIDGQRLVVGIAMDQLRPAALAPPGTPPRRMGIVQPAVCRSPICAK